MKSISFTMAYVFNIETHKSQFMGAIMYLVAHGKKVNSKNIKSIFMTNCNVTGFIENIDVKFACDMIGVEYDDKLYEQSLEEFERLQ